MLRELAALSVHNLLRARARLMMTSGGVMIGTTAVVLLIALTIGLQSAAEASIGNDASLTQITIRSGFRRDDSSPTLDMDAVNQLAALKNVGAVIPTLSLSNRIELRVGNLRGFAQVYGIYPATLPYLGVKAQQGTLTLDTNDPYGVVVGASVAKNFTDSSSGTNTATTVDLMTNAVEMRVYSQDGTFRRIPITVNALLESGSSQDFAIFLPMQTVIDLNNRLSTSSSSSDDLVYSQIIVQASSRETVDTLMSDIQELGYNATGMGSYLSQLNGFFGIMRLMLGGVGGVAMLVAAFGVANTMTMAILERTREIGLMKAVGATDRAVLTIFLIEAGLVGLIGGITGLAISYLLQYAVNTILADNVSGTISIMSINISQLNGSLIVIPAELSILALVLATGIGVGAGLSPALRAARMTPVVALRTE
jgi:putative ABC transport system permease protein